MTTPIPGRLTRRQLLAAGAAAVAVGGCASPSRSPSIGRVVIVGGGYGGATAAHYLRRWGGNVDVTLVEREAAFVSCPMSNLVVGGRLQIGDVTTAYDGLRRAGVDVVRGEAVAIDAAAKTLRLADGRTLRWDRLVLSPGIDFMADAVGGLPAALDTGRVLHAWKAGPQTVALARQIDAMRPGGVFAMTIPRAPYRCPPGPYERACLVAARLKVVNPRAKVLILDANPEITSKKGLFERAFADHYAGIVEYRANNALQRVDGTTAKLEFDDVKADVLNVIPAQRAGDIARSAGLLNMNDRWAGVDWLTMESTAVPGIHVIGDAVFPAPAMPKSGHMANQHGKVAAAAIVRLLQGRPVDDSPVVMNTCYSFTTPDEAMHVASVHRYDPAEKTFKAVPGSGGVSAAASAAEAAYARSWATNIWADTLAL